VMDVIEKRVSRNITLVQGDLFSSRAQTLVNTVNCVGVMGAGIAKEFRRRWPRMYKVYKEACKRGDVRIGYPLLCVMPDKWVLNFPTKQHWRGPSKLEYIERGLTFIIAHYREWGIQSMAFPQLGTNLGGLNWEEVWPLMQEYLEYLDIPIEVYVDVGRRQVPVSNSDATTLKIDAGQIPLL
jgi:O-acetyl-ADP-ribose deacetylase (regulator of RNase III)